MSTVKIIQHEHNGTEYKGYKWSGFDVLGFGFSIIQIDSNGDYKVKGSEKSSFNVSDPPNPDEIATAIKNAAEDTANHMPQPPGPEQIATAVSDAIKAALQAMPAPPSPEVISDAISDAIKSLQFPLLPIQATLLGDDNKPVTTTINIPDLKAIGTDITANIGGTKDPISFSIDTPDIKSVGIGGTKQPFKVDPVELAFRWDKLPTGRLRFSLPSLWFSITIFKWKIFGFKVEVEGNLDLISEP